MAAVELYVPEMALSESVPQPNVAESCFSSVSDKRVHRLLVMAVLLVGARATSCDKVRARLDGRPRVP